jgi:hypothetical protein
VFWTVLTIAFEFCLGHIVFRRPWKDLASDYDMANGGLLALGMVVLLFAPLIANSLRGLIERRRVE